MRGGIQRKKIVVLIFIASFVLHVLPILGDELKVQAQVDHKEVATGQVLVFSVTIAGPIKQTPTIELTSFKGFEVVSTGQSQHIQILDGQIRNALTLTYTLAPTTPGIHTIGPVKVHYDGQVIQTQPIEIKVVEGSSAVAPEEESSVETEPEQFKGSVRKPDLKGDIIL